MRPTGFVFGEKDQAFRVLVTKGDFREVSVQSPVDPVRFLSPEEFVRLYIAGPPLTCHFEEVDETSQAALSCGIQ